MLTIIHLISFHVHVQQIDVKVVEVLRNPDRFNEGEDETDQTVSKEEEERYRKLQQENEQLQQLIASREQKLKMLNQRLLERNTSANLNGPNNITAPVTNTQTNVATASTASPAITNSPVSRSAIIHQPPVKKNRFAYEIFSNKKN